MACCTDIDAAESRMVKDARAKELRVTRNKMLGLLYCCGSTRASRPCYLPACKHRVCSLTIGRIRFGMRLIPALRRVVSACLVVMYLLSGALHGILDVDVANPSGSSMIVVADGKSSQSPERGMVQEHHCHGCFSVSVPAPVQQTAFVVEPKIAELLRSTAPLSDTVRGLDPPPPKSLT